MCSELLIPALHKTFTEELFAFATFIQNRGLSMIQVRKSRPREEHTLPKVRMPESQSKPPPWTLEYRSAYLCFSETWCAFEGAKLTLPILKDPR